MDAGVAQCKHLVKKTEFRGFWLLGQWAIGYRL